MHDHVRTLRSNPSDSWTGEAYTLENGAQMSTAISWPSCHWGNGCVLFLTERADVAGIQRGKWWWRQATDRRDAEALTPTTLRAPRKSSTPMDACSRNGSAEMAHDLGPGDHHKAMVLEVRIAAEGGTAVPLFPPPTPELAASLIETDFNLALRAVDN